jgi:hypothetical protein
MVEPMEGEGNQNNPNNKQEDNRNDDASKNETKHCLQIIGDAKTTKNN